MNEPAGEPSPDASDDELSRDITYWITKTPAERLAALERLRQRAYGYDHTLRMVKVWELVRRDEIPDSDDA